jgi:hypothetical protein
MKKTVMMVFGLALLAPAARADELDRFREACQAGDWSAAETAWGALVETGPQPLALVLRHAEVVLHLGRPLDALRDAEAVREKEPRNMEALVLLARLRAKESPDEAKALLLEAGREGYPILREARASKELRELVENPPFVLAAMRVSAQMPTARASRDPFLVPRSIWAPQGATGPAGPKPPPPVDKMSFEQFVALGNKQLREMVDLLRQEKLSEVGIRFLEVKALCDRVRRERSEEEFSRTADELERRAARLDAEARKLLKVRDLKIVVTGVVVSQIATNRAIVSVGDRTGSIYEVGDELRDFQGERIRGLKVSKIAEGLVGFDYEGIEFVRPLRQSP